MTRRIARRRPVAPIATESGLHEALVVPDADVAPGTGRVSAGATEREATTPDELMRAVSTVTPDA